MGKCLFATVTRGRVGCQYFLERLPDETRLHITIVCHPGEKQLHEERWAGKVADIIEYGAHCTDIGQARGWLMNYCRVHGYNKVIMIDDNVVFGARIKGEELDWTGRLQTISLLPKPVQRVMYNRVFTWMAGALDAYGAAGISHRSGNQNKDTPTEENTRLFAVWGVNVEKYFTLEQRFEDIPLKEDFYIQLGFLTKGIKTISNNLFVFGKAKGANQAGGCSLYRTLDAQNQGSRMLKKAFPDFVTLCKKNNDHWNGIGKEDRIETIVYWKKAYGK